MWVYCFRGNDDKREGGEIGCLAVMEALRAVVMEGVPLEAQVAEELLQAKLVVVKYGSLTDGGGGGGGGERGDGDVRRWRGRRWSKYWKDWRYREWEWKTWKLKWNSIESLINGVGKDRGISHGQIRNNNKLN